MDLHLHRYLNVDIFQKFKFSKIKFLTTDFTYIQEGGEEAGEGGEAALGGLSGLRSMCEREILVT